MNQEITPRRAWYVLPAIALVAGGIGAALLITQGVQGIGSGLERVLAPGTATVNLDEPGRWTVFYEYRSFFEGEAVDAPFDSPPIRVTLTSPSGAVNTGSASGANLTYQLPRAAGYSIGYFDIDEPGRYSVLMEPTDPNQQPVVLAFGHEKGRSVGRLVAGIGLGALSLLLALVSFGLVLLFRSRSKRKIEQGQLSYGYPPPPGAGSPGPPAA